MRFLADVRERSKTPEVMDDPGLDPARHASALTGLARINFFSGVVRAFWSSIVASGLAKSGGTLRILDVASGGGDVPIGIWKRARAAGVDVEVTGSDVSGDAVAFAARRAADAGANVEFRVVDVLSGDLPTGFDVLTNSLFLHHLEERDVVGFLGRSREVARRLVLVDDLDRSPTGHLFARIGTHLVSRSDVVHTDGPRSVEGAFTMEEARELASRAGLSSARIARRFPWRWHLSWVAP